MIKLIRLVQNKIKKYKLKYNYMFGKYDNDDLTVKIFQDNNSGGYIVDFNFKSKDGDYLKHRTNFLKLVRRRMAMQFYLVTSDYNDKTNSGRFYITKKLDFQTIEYIFKFLDKYIKKFSSIDI